MSIVSFQFLVFLAVLIVLYFGLPKQYQWMVLLAGSYFFYVAVGGLIALAYISGATFIVYAAARIVGKWLAEEKENGVSTERRRKAVVHLAVIINLAGLIGLKYGIFLLTEVLQLTQIFGFSFTVPEQTWILPLGISFYTLTSIGYLLDVAHGKDKPENNYFKVALFVSYFPHIVQGPFCRFRELGHQFFVPHEWDYTRVKHGVERMVWGYFMKMVIADRMAVIVSEVCNNYAVKGYVGFTVMLGVMVYSVQIYADFFGGMNIIYGVSEIFGISVEENFRQPFMATSVAEFWRRWHISLGTWMKTYVFYPIALSPTFTKLGKFMKTHFGRNAGKVVPASIASFFVFILVGMWHGASMKYVVYGIWNATMVSTNTLFDETYRKMRKFFHVNEKAFSWKAFQVIRTYFLTLFGRYFSRGNSLADAIAMLKATFSSFNPWIFFDGTIYSLGLNQKNFNLMLIMIVLLAIVDVLHERGVSIREKLDSSDIVLRWTVYFAVIFAIIIFGTYGTELQLRDFIYQGF